MTSSAPVAVVTGSNCGIGFETARALVKQGYHVVLACRSEVRAQSAVERLQDEVKQARVTFLKLDLASFSSIREFVAMFTKLRLPCQVLVNNAGASLLPRTEDGLEGVFVVNYLSHVYLTLLMMPILKQSAPARVVNVSSVMHRFGNIDFQKALT